MSTVVYEFGGNVYETLSSAIDAWESLRNTTGRVESIREIGGQNRLFSYLWGCTEEKMLRSSSGNAYFFQAVPFEVLWDECDEEDPQPKSGSNDTSFLVDGQVCPAPHDAVGESCEIDFDDCGTDENGSYTTKYRSYYPNIFHNNAPVDYHVAVPKATRAAPYVILEEVRVYGTLVVPTDTYYLVSSTGENAKVEFCDPPSHVEYTTDFPTSCRWIERPDSYKVKDFIVGYSQSPSGTRGGPFPAPTCAKEESQGEDSRVRVLYEAVYSNTQPIDFYEGGVVYPKHDYNRLEYLTGIRYVIFHDGRVARYNARIQPTYP